MTKYAEPREIPRIHAIWHSLPAQLSKENRKFIYKVIKSGARSKDYDADKTGLNPIYPEQSVFYIRHFVFHPSVCLKRTYVCLDAKY